MAEPLFKPQLDQDARMSQTFVEKLNLFSARIATRPRAGGFLMILRLPNGSPFRVAHTLSQ
ncbi:hypothetical protein [Pseudomonas aeruginosa]